MPDFNNPELRKPRATTKEDKDLRDKLFVDAMGAGSTPKEAALAVGYAESCAESEGYRMKKRLHDRISEKQVMRLQRGAIFASKELVRLALNADQEAVRLKACISVLDRALGKPTDHIVQETTTTMKMEEQTTEELEAELASLLKGSKLEGEGLDNVVLMNGVSAEEALDPWVAPPGFGPDPEIDEDDEGETR